MQFHLEVDGALAAEWMEVPEYVAELEQLAGADAPARMLAEVRAAEAETVPLARGLFTRWLVGRRGALSDLLHDHAHGPQPPVARAADRAAELERAADVGERLRRQPLAGSTFGIPGG